VRPLLLLLLLLHLLQVTRQVFEAAKGKLKVVGRAGVGVDNVDLAAATEVGKLAQPAHLLTALMWQQNSWDGSEWCPFMLHHVQVTSMRCHMQQGTGSACSSHA
jgi:hypothetical protein